MPHLLEPEANQAPEQQEQQPQEQQNQGGLLNEEEQNAYEQAILFANDIIFGDEAASAEVQNILKSEGDKADIAAEAATIITALTDRRLDLPEAAIIPIAIGTEGEDGNEEEEAVGILDIVIDAAEELSGVEMSEAQIQKAHILTIQKLIEEYGGTEEDFFAAIEEQGFTKEEFSQGISSLESLGA